MVAVGLVQPSSTSAPRDAAGGVTMVNEDPELRFSPLDTQRDPADTRCEYCGKVIDTNDWYPMVKERDANGFLRFYSFCSEGCRTAWLDEHRG